MKRRKKKYRICPKCDGWAAVTGSCERCGRRGIVRGR